MNLPLGPRRGLASTSADLRYWHSANIACHSEVVCVVLPPLRWLLGDLLQERLDTHAAGLIQALQERTRATTVP